MQRLLNIMEQLRDPENGCPWDREQTFETIAPYTIEEAYEVADAIAEGDHQELKAELGDLLFQVVFYAQMAREQGWFGFDEIVEGICDKMVRRHPHVFGDAEVQDAESQSRAWEQHKALERQQKGGDGTAGQLAGVARALPALLRSEKLQKRAAKVGFDWDGATSVLEKVEEELGELRRALAGGEGQQRLEEELGDLLFSCVNLGRHLGVGSEQALRRANDKFERRFQSLERLLAAEGVSLQEAAPEHLDRLWEGVKRLERATE